MKTSELIKQIEAMGLRAVERNRSIAIENNFDQTIAVASKKEMFEISTIFTIFKFEPEEIKKSLYHFLIEYAGTPIEEREPEKKYWLRVPGIREESAYINYNMKDECFHVGSEYAIIEYKTTFTETEIDNFPEDIKSLITVAERIEVAQDEL